MLQVNISTSEKDMIIWLIIPHAEQLHAHMLFFEILIKEKNPLFILFVKYGNQELRF